MLHRHLNHSDWTLAAIDDAIARGSRLDWRELRDTADQDRLFASGSPASATPRSPTPKRNGTTSGMASL